MNVRLSKEREIKVLISCNSLNDNSCNTIGKQMSGFRGSVLVGLLLVSLLSSCGSNGYNTGTETVETSETETGEIQSIPVTVTDFSGNNVQGADIILGDRDGKMKAFGTTDADGQITFTDAPADATITAAVSCVREGSTRTSYSVYVYYDVNAPVDVTVNTCTGPVITPRSIDPLGTLTVNVTNTMSNVVRNRITTGGTSLEYDYLITQQTINVTPNDLQSDGTLSLIVIGMDAYGDPDGYGILTGLTFEDGMTVDITVDKPMSYVTYEITNRPAAAVKLSYNILLSLSNGVIGFSDLYSIPLKPIPTVIVFVPYIPGIGNPESYGLTLYLDQDNDQVIDSQQVLQKRETLASTPLNQTFDFSKALKAPANLALSGGDTVTPTLSWTGIDPGATFINVAPFLRLNPTYSWSLTIGKLSPARIRITFPEMPDYLSAFRPDGINSFSLSISDFADNVFRFSTGAYPSMALPY